jgi:hypothetical protein
MRQPLRIVKQGSCIVIRGNAKLILDKSPFRPLYVGGNARGWMLDAHREADLLAYLDSRGVPYVLGESA